MCSGLSSIRTHIARYPLTGFIRTIVAYSDTIYGRGSKLWFLEIATPQRKSTNSNMFPILSKSMSQWLTPLYSLRFALAPRWRGLHHFSGVMKVSFTDGAKFEDISKVRQLYVASSRQLTDSESPQVVIFAAQNVIQRSDDEEGWQLLLCLRSFSILDLLLSFEVHTEKTILAGRGELERFGCLMKVLNFFLMTPWC